MPFSTSVILTPRELGQLRRVERVAFGWRADAGLGSAATTLEVHAPAGRWRRIVYCSRPQVLRAVIAGVGVPRNVGLFGRPGILTSGYAELVWREAQAHGAEVRFVGDLEPIAFAALASLLAARPRHKGDKWTTARYRGVDDSWLAFLAREFTSRRAPTLDLAGLSFPLELCTRMTASERAQLAAMEAAGLELARLVGPASESLLRRRLTVSLLVVCNQSRFRRGFRERLAARLWGR